MSPILRRRKMTMTRRKSEMNECKHICCICGKEFAGYGNSPYPVKDDDTDGKWNVCCDECNIKVVVPERLKMCQKY